MTAGTAALVSVAGGLGALLRLLVGRAVVQRTGEPLALGTLVVNLSGAAMLGLLTGLAPGSETTMVLGLGLLGGYTTFSTWMYESQRFVREGVWGVGAANVAGSTVLGVLAVWLGRAIAGG